MVTGASNRVAFRDVLAVVEFRALCAAQVLSLVGDQFARVALSVLVFRVTHSALLTAAVYALGFLPAVIGGPLLGGLADRLPRRRLMIVCDLARAGLVLAMALGSAHLVLVGGLVVLVELLSAPFGAARAALLADILHGESYLVGSAIGNITTQFAQFLGFALGGGLVATLGSTRTLLLDAASFVASALLLLIAVRPRPIHLPADSMSAPRAPARATVGVIAKDPQLRLLVLLALLCGCYVVPEGLAAPYAQQLGGSATAVGLLMAAQPIGACVGAVLLARLVRSVRRPALMLPLAFFACAPLLGCALNLDLAAVLALLVLSGVGQAYQLVANAAFVSAVPAWRRGQAFALVQSAIQVVQGIGFLAAGAAAEALGAGRVIALAGGAGAVAVVGLSLIRPAATPAGPTSLPAAPSTSG